MNSWASENVFLGTGGCTPGVEVLDIISGNLSKVLSLPLGESVYALDITPDGHNLAAGTRSGFLYWLSADLSGKEEYKTRRIVQGAAVISVFFWDI